MHLNPYTPGAGRRPFELAGRSIPLALVMAAAEQFEGGYEAESMIFHGLRGMGKTVFLRAVAERLQTRGWLCGYYSVRHGVEAEVAVANLIAEAAPLLPGGSRLARAAKGLTARIGSVSLCAGPGGLRVEAADTPAGKDLFGDLVRVLRQLGEQAQQDGRGVALLVDELQELRRADMAALIDAVGTVSALPVVLIGAGLPYLPSELSSACTWAERLRYESLGPLPPAAGRLAVTAPAHAVGIRLEDDATSLIVDTSEGYPFFLQLYASEAWRVAQIDDDHDTIDLDHVTEAIPAVRRILADGMYAARYGRASTGERSYLEAMARIEAQQPTGGIGSGEVARNLGRPLSALSTTRESLIRKGLIHSPSKGVIDFSVPGFGSYVLWRAEDI